MIAFLYEFLYVFAVSAGSAAALAPVIGLEQATGAAVVITAAVAAGVTAFRHLPWTGRLIMTGFPITVASALFMLTRNETIREILSGYLAFLWLPLIGVGAALFGELFAHFKNLRRIAAGLGVVILIVLTAFDVETEKTSVAAVLLLFLLVATDEVQRTWNKSGYTDAKAHLVCVSPFLLLVMLLVFISPSPKDPYDWAFVRAAYRRVSQTVEEISIRLAVRGLSDAAEAGIGFSGRGGFGGELEGSDKEVMTVFEIPAGVSGLRLTGKTFDTFDGREWKALDPSRAPDGELDALSLLASAEDFTDTPDDLVRKSTLRIRYLQINTAHVFAPLKTISAGPASLYEQMRHGGGDLLWPSRKTFQTEYEVSWLRQNSDHPLFVDYLRSVTVPTRESFERYTEICEKDHTAGYSYEDLLSHREHIMEWYAKPVTLSDPIRTYMDSLYGEASDPGDRMEQLEQFLRVLTYTEAPGALPRKIHSGTDYLDYLLMESREGYCSHFATAFVLLARAEGLPARYVQGYLIYPGESASATVVSSMAHAWPEVYYDGAGWIAYEPTPGYERTSYWRSAEEMKQITEKAKSGYPAGREDAEPVPLPELEEKDSRKISVPWYAVVIPLVSGLLFMLLLFAAGRLVMRIKTGRMDLKERYHLLCRLNLMLLGLLGLGMEAQETLREYHLRISGEAGEENTSFLMQLERFLYGGGRVNKEQEQEAANTKERLSERLRQEHPLRYLRFRSRWG
ncbi:MAG: DUF3488 and transglutaminase-like domain-containing protein [Lachnospiraceae bacterium]|nr:DUF3488 and transglutaminase-like domain-containing protein [Lachnospiraceae bacterium]